MLTEPSVQSDVGCESSSPRYKYQRLRESLRQAIEQGELGGKLPGERELAHRYGANAKTINKALSDLTTEGLLIRHVGRGTFVAGSSPTESASPSGPLTFAWLTCGDCHEGEDRLYRQAETLLREKRHHIRQLRPDDRGAAGPEQSSPIRPAQLREINGVILCASRPPMEWLADLLRRHIPVVMINNCHETVRVHSVTMDCAQGTFELCEQLIQLGHRKIRLLIDPAWLPGARAAERGYRTAMQRCGLRPHEAYRVDAEFGWAGLLAGDERPTGLICAGVDVALQASREAAGAGLTQPAMLSISALAEPADARLAESSITGYEVDGDRIIYWAIELLLSASPGQAPRVVIVPGQLEDRGSAAPPTSALKASGQPPAEAIL